MHKSYFNNNNPLCSSLPDLAGFACNTRQADAANSILFYSVIFNTTQFSRSFGLATTKMWNGMHSAVVESSDLQNFKRGAFSFLSSVVAK